MTQMDELPIFSDLNNWRLDPEIETLCDEYISGQLKVPEMTRCQFRQVFNACFFDIWKKLPDMEPKTLNDVVENNEIGERYFRVLARGLQEKKEFGQLYEEYNNGIRSLATAKNLESSGIFREISRGAVFRNFDSETYLRAFLIIIASEYMFHTHDASNIRQKALKQFSQAIENDFVKLKKLLIDSERVELAFKRKLSAIRINFAESEESQIIATQANELMNSSIINIKGINDALIFINDHYCKTAGPKGPPHKVEKAAMVQKICKFYVRVSGLDRTASRAGSTQIEEFANKILTDIQFTRHSENTNIASIIINNSKAADFKYSAEQLKALWLQKEPIDFQEISLFSSVRINIDIEPSKSILYS